MARPVAPGQRRAGAPQGDRPPRRLPRGDAGGALVHRHPGLPHRLRAAGRPDRPRLLTNAYRHPDGRRRGRASRKALLAEIEEVIEFEGAGDDRDDHHGAGPERRRLDRPARRLLAGPARDLRPPRDPARLRRGDLRLRPARRLVRRPAARLRARPDHLRQGPDRRPRRDGRGDDLRQGRRALPDGKGDYLHGITFGGHPVGSAIALGAIEIYRARERPRQRAAPTSRSPRELLEGPASDIPIVGDVRGMGHFFAIEVVKDQATREALRRGRGRLAAQGRALRPALRDAA